MELVVVVYELMNLKPRILSLLKLWKAPSHMLNNNNNNNNNNKRNLDFPSANTPNNRLVCDISKSGEAATRLQYGHWFLKTIRLEREA
jgi:hypothetical protein